MKRCCDYIVQIIHATREHDDILLGGSPRASMALLHSAQALAAIQGYDFVLPDDVKQHRATPCWAID